TVPCAVILGLLATMASAAPLTGRVVSDKGEGLAARVLAYQPATRESAEVYTKPDGSFTLDVPEGKLCLIATHGPEWSVVQVEATAGEVCTLTLKRLVDMPARGYYGADFHMHSTGSDGKQTPEQVAYDCRAEGLHIAALSDHESVRGHGEWLAQAGPDFLPLPAQEITTKLGHVVGVDIREKVPNDVAKGAEDFQRIFGEVHGQGGFAIVAHPNAPGMTYQCPGVREYDALEILNGSIPPYGGLFDFVQGRKAWHSLLSQGLQVACVGDSDNHDNLSTTPRTILHDPAKAAQLDKRIGGLMRMVDFEKVLEPWAWKGLHPGIYRTYLQLSEPTPEAVRVAVKQGHGFVTNGPLILAKLDDQAPGNEIKANGRAALTLSLESIANRPLDKFVVLVSGQPVATSPVSAEPTQVTVPVRAGDWVTVELYGAWPEFATTNAWYIR
ncbi:MAG: CehA/McbA family metallohydrolase, partial [Bacteroidota bacterium]